MWVKRFLIAKALVDIFTKEKALASWGLLWSLWNFAKSRWQLYSSPVADAGGLHGWAELAVARGHPLHVAAAPGLRPDGGHRQLHVSTSRPLQGGYTHVATHGHSRVKCQVITVSRSCSTQGVSNTGHVIVGQAVKRPEVLCINKTGQIKTRTDLASDLRYDRYPAVGITCIYLFGALLRIIFPSLYNTMKMHRSR